MKKEEQIKQLRVQLLAYNDTVCFTESKLDVLKANRQVVIDQLDQLEKDSKETKEYFSGVVITSYVDCNGVLQELETPTAVKAMYEEYPNVQFLGYNNKRYVFSCIGNTSVGEIQPNIVLFFGKKVEKPLKHPHMEDIVATFCISASDEFEVEKLTDADKINWEDCDEVQIIGEDQEYGIVVKATLLKEIPNQFSLFFCEKK